MSVETEVEEPLETGAQEVAERVPPTRKQDDLSLDFLKALEDQDQEDDTEQVDGVEDSAADDSGDEKAEEAAAPEGPSEYLLRAAAAAGVPQRLIEMAVNDDQLASVIEYHAEESKAKAEPEREPPKTISDDELKLELGFGEDEFDENDPVHKALKTVVEKFNKLQEKHTTALAHFAAFANQTLDRQKNDEQEQVRTRIQAPFDATLDEFGVKEFGKFADGTPLTKAQIAERTAIWDAAVKLGIDEKTAPEEIARLVKVAVQAKRPGLFTKFQETQRGKAKQPRSVIGGPKAAKPREPEMDFADMLRKARPGQFR